MEKLEAIILIVVVLAGIAGLYYFFSAGAGQATRMLKGCEGDFTLQLAVLEKLQTTALKESEEMFGLLTFKIEKQSSFLTAKKHHSWALVNHFLEARQA